MNRCYENVLRMEHMKDFTFPAAMQNDAVQYDRREPMTLDEARLDAERNTIVSILKKCGGNKSEAARILGISRQMLYNKIRSFQIE